MEKCRKCKSAFIIKWKIKTNYPGTDKPPTECWCQDYESVRFCPYCGRRINEQSIHTGLSRFFSNFKCLCVRMRGGKLNVGGQ